MTFDEEQQQRALAVIDSICYWLGYQHKIGRSQLIHEASLRYPIADTLTSGGIAMERIMLESTSAIFSDKSIDLVIYDTNGANALSEKDDSNLLDAYEFKLAKYATGLVNNTEYQRVFDDVVRLAYYHLWSKKNCYFLMCGEYEDFKSRFVSQATPPSQVDGKNRVTPKVAGQMGATQWNPEGLYSDWFAFEIGVPKTKTFDSIDQTDKSEWGLSSFRHRYVPRPGVGAIGQSVEIKTTCLAITPSGLEGVRTHAAGIWRIEGIR